MRTLPEPGTKGERYLTRFPAWLFRSRLIRQVFYGSCRVVWRIQRASLARAVLVVRNRDGRILVLGEPSGTLQLPLKMLDGRVTVTTRLMIGSSRFCHGPLRLRSLQWREQAARVSPLSTRLRLM